MRQPIVSDKLAKPVGPFSPAIRSGNLIFFSGQVAQDPATGKLVTGDVAAQTEQLFRNLGALLEAAGRGFGDVVKANVYLTDMGDFAAMNAIYGKAFAEPYPARTTVAVQALPLGAKVEIELVVQC